LPTENSLVVVVLAAQGEVKGDAELRSNGSRKGERRIPSTRRCCATDTLPSALPSSPSCGWLATKRGGQGFMARVRAQYSSYETQRHMFCRIIYKRPNLCIILFLSANILIIDSLVPIILTKEHLGVIFRICGVEII
jgi:hypothetical protein